MVAKGLGGLEKAELGEFWVTETGNFTLWLAQDDNNKLLDTAIGIEIEVETL